MNVGPSGPQQCVSGVYNAAGVSLVNGQQAPLQMDATGKVMVNAGSITASLGGFAPSGNYTTPLSVSGSSANTAINGADPVQMITNVGSVTAYVNLGSSNAVTATTSDIPVSPGAAVPLTVGSNSYIAAITATGTTTLNIAGGSGLLTGIAGSPSVSGSNPAAGSTGAAVPSSASYEGLNVAGNLRGQTGVNPTGSVYAAQTDLSSVGGASVALGQTTMSASVPVAIASNQTSFPVKIDQTTPGSTNAVDATNFPATADAGAGNYSSSTIRTVLATNQPAVAITAASLPLPSTAATSTNQATEITALGTINTTLGTPLQAGGNIGTVSAVTAITNDVNTQPATDNFVSGTASATGTSSTQLVALSSGKSLWITEIDFGNTSATTITVAVQDGSGGTTLKTYIVPAGGGIVVSAGGQPLIKTTSGNGLYFACSGGESTIYANASGFAK